jgi:aspartyl/glutamyl-tRNA(Asn/Gln) amidotransferase C subunit
MPENIDVKKVAELARLKLDDIEEKYFKEKFNEILNYVSSIAEVEIEDDVLEKDESLQKIFQEDIAQKSDVSPDQFSNYVENKFFKVPKIIN